MRARTGGASSSGAPEDERGRRRSTRARGRGSTRSARPRRRAAARARAATVADCTASATHGRFRKPALRRNDRRARTARRRRRAGRDSGNGSHMRGHGRPSTTSGGTTVMRTMCCDMCSREPRVGPVVERRLEHDERERDAAVEAHLAPERGPPPPAAGRRARPPSPHTTRGSGSMLDQVEDDPGDDGDPGEERPVEAEPDELGADERERVADVVRRPMRVAGGIARASGVAVSILR